MNSLLSKIVVTGALVLGTSVAFGAQFKIKMYDKHFKGENTIALKQLIKEQHPGVNLSKQKINIVTMKAKSKRGNGKVRLMVNGYELDREVIDGREYDFQSSHRSTFDYIVMTAIGAQKGNWKLGLKGNIKVRNIEVTTTKIAPTPRPRPVPTQPFFQSFGSKKVDKFIVDTDSFYVNEYDVEAIRISAKGSNLEIESVRVFLDNGRVLDMGEFRGYLREGSQITHYFRTRRAGVNIDKVVINATSTNLIGSRGEVQLELGQEKF